MFKGPRYTESELMARLKFTVGLSLAFTLTGIVLGKQEKPEIPEAPKAPEPTLGDVTPADLVPEPVAEVAPLVVAAAAGAAVVAAADDDEDTIA